MEKCPKCVKGLVKNYHPDGSVCPNGRLEILLTITKDVTKADLKKAWDASGLEWYKFEEFCKHLGL